MKGKLDLKLTDKLYYKEKLRKQILDLKRYIKNLKHFQISKNKTKRKLLNLRKWFKREIEKLADLEIYILEEKRLTL